MDMFICSWWAPSLSWGVPQEDLETSCQKVFKMLSLLPEVVRYETGRWYNHVSYYVKKRDLHCGRRQKQEQDGSRDTRCRILRLFQFMILGLICFYFLAMSLSMWDLSSPTRDQTCAVGVQNLNHWATGKSSWFLFYLSSSCSPSLLA